MDAEHRQPQIGNRPLRAARAIGHNRVEVAALGTEPDIDGADIGLRAQAIGQDATVG